VKGENGQKQTRKSMGKTTWEYEIENGIQPAKIDDSLTPGVGIWIKLSERTHSSVKRT